MGAFTDLLHRLAVWEMGRIVPGCDPTEWRMDSLGSCSPPLRLLTQTYYYQAIHGFINTLVC
jgi:hypothetical protein